MPTITELKAQLRTLKGLHDEGLIDADTYAQRSEPLLAEIEKASREHAAAAFDPYAQAAPVDKGTRLADLRPGDELRGGERRFRLVDRIGSGGMGDVWQAVAESDGDETVALKLLEPGRGAKETDLDRLREEAQRARRLSHPNIVNVYGWHKDTNGLLFVEMEYLKGRSLDRVLREEGNPGLPLARVLEWLKPAAEAIDWAYRKHGLIHRDIKPGNLFLCDDGELKVLDFGISAVARGTSAGTVVMQDSAGTDEYLAPECRRAHKLKPQQDVYALGVTLYELLTRECPWPGRMAMLRMPERIDSDWPEAPEVLGDARWAVLKQAMAYEAAPRPESCAAFVSGLVGAASPALPRIELIHGWDEGGVKGLQEWTAKALGKPVVYRDRLKDGSEGPELVVIPAGRFVIGSPESEAEREDNEGPQHEVEIAKPFGLGRYAVTRDDFARYVEETGYRTEGERGDGAYGWTGSDWKWDKEFSWRNPGYEQTGRDPVVCVSWNDAQAYVEWLSEQTGRRYRLPTEAEWEYGCRAGTEAAFNFGGISAGKANYDANYPYEGSPKGEWRERTVAVEEFEGNRWGLYQMHGNVWEWTCSAYDDEGYKQGGNGAHTKCAEPGDPAGRALRGGSWYDLPRWLRSAYRYSSSADNRDFNVGFRLAQDL